MNITFWNKFGIGYCVEAKIGYSCIANGTRMVLFIKAFSYFRLAQNLFDAVDEFVPRMSLLTTPMLILHGTDDKVCLLNGSQMLHESIKSQENSLKVSTAYGNIYYIFNSRKFSDRFWELLVISQATWKQHSEINKFIKCCCNDAGSISLSL